MGLFSFDLTCGIAAFLMVITNVTIISNSIQYRNREHFDYEKLIGLDTDSIQDDFAYRLEKGNSMLIGSFLSCITMMVLLIPIVKVAMIQYSIASNNYRTIRTLGLHVTIVALAVSGTITECIAGVLQLGTSVAADWIAVDFNLNDWIPMNVNANGTSSTGVDDMIGWKTLSLVSIITESMMMWVDALAYFFLSIVFLLLFFSVRSTKDSETYFQKHWTYYGIFVGVLCFIDFIASILRLQSWMTFSGITFLISIVNGTILIPIWLLWLGKQLLVAEEAISNKNIQSNNNMS